MSDLNVDIRCTAQGWLEAGDLQSVAAAAIGAVANVLPNRPKGAVSILLTDDAEMADLNQQWRGKRGPTDVLSFSAGPDAGAFLGDIAVGYDICARDSAAAGRPLKHHLAHMLIHGFLHLLGYDHESDTEASEMEALEVKALASLGLPDPYSLKA